VWNFGTVRMTVPDVYCGASYLSLLQAVAVRCALPYVSLVSEVTADGGAVYGVEIEVPLLIPIVLGARCFLGV